MSSARADLPTCNSRHAMRGESGDFSLEIHPGVARRESPSGIGSIIFRAMLKCKMLNVSGDTRVFIGRLHARRSNQESNRHFDLQELRRQCQDFATALLDHTRSSYELEVLLNHDPTGPAFEHGERMHLNRLKLAIKLRQKKVKKKMQEERIS